MDCEAIGKQLAQKCVERMSALNLKGKKREDAAIDFYIGAAIGVELAGNKELADYFKRIAMLIVAIRGFKEVERIAIGDKS